MRLSFAIRSLVLLPHRESGFRKRVLQAKRVDLPVGFGLGVKEKPLITVFCARPRLDLGYQSCGEGDPTLSAPSTKGGGTAEGA